MLRLSRLLLMTIFLIGGVSTAGPSTSPISPEIRLFVKSKKSQVHPGEAIFLQVVFWGPQGQRLQFSTAGGGTGWFYLVITNGSEALVIELPKLQPFDDEALGQLPAHQWMADAMDASYPLMVYPDAPRWKLAQRPGEKLRFRIAYGVDHDNLRAMVAKTTGLKVRIHAEQHKALHEAYRGAVLSDVVELDVVDSCPATRPDDR